MGSNKSLFWKLGCHQNFFFTLPNWIFGVIYRTKLKQTEVDCEYLKRCCDNLTQENRRLQKEVQELRVLKLSPQLYMQMNPPTTLTMCPSCERVTPSSSSAAGAGATKNRHPPSSYPQRPVAVKAWPPVPFHTPPSTRSWRFKLARRCRRLIWVVRMRFCLGRIF